MMPRSRAIAFCCAMRCALGMSPAANFIAIFPLHAQYVASIMSRSSVSMPRAINARPTVSHCFSATGPGIGNGGSGNSTSA